MVMDLLHELPHLRHYVKLRKQALSSASCDEIGKKKKTKKQELVEIEKVMIGCIFVVDVYIVVFFGIEIEIVRLYSFLGY